MQLRASLEKCNPQSAIVAVLSLILDAITANPHRAGLHPDNRFDYRRVTIFGISLGDNRFDYRCRCVHIFTGVVEDGCNLFPTNMNMFEQIKEYPQLSNPPLKYVVCTVQIYANA